MGPAEPRGISRSRFDAFDPAPPNCPRSYAESGLLLSNAGRFTKAAGVSPFRLVRGRAVLSPLLHASMIRRAAGRVPNRCSFRHSSRNRPLKLSTNPLCCGLPGAMSSFSSIAQVTAFLREPGVRNFLPAYPAASRPRASSPAAASSAARWTQCVQPSSGLFQLAGVRHLHAPLTSTARRRTSPR
jgi:hypothetical protein